MPCSGEAARRLLWSAVAPWSPRYPFAIRLKDRVGGDTRTGAAALSTPAARPRCWR
ncbi:MAG: hypothetical protein U5L98_08830 [Halomonas sp.]|uniref:hypothetical protein n=1 Tax=Halomonas sp. TaxID=1486246 RepID=UPI002ACD6141|nr:hypothetical protein [Halomonas sp.]MDZ7852729.1 hypothetical protein [Halomonas sp.]